MFMLFIGAVLVCRLVTSSGRAPLGGGGRGETRCYLGSWWGLTWRSSTALGLAMCVGSLEERAVISRERCSPSTASGWKYGRYTTHTHTTLSFRLHSSSSQCSFIRTVSMVSSFL
eukprot:sb/3476803/